MDPAPINSINLTCVTLPSRGVTTYLKNKKYSFKFNSLLPLNNSLFLKSKSSKHCPDTSNAKYIFNLFLWFPFPCSLSQIGAYLYNINIFFLSDIYLNCFYVEQSLWLTGWVPAFYIPYVTAARRRKRLANGMGAFRAANGRYPPGEDPGRTRQNPASERPTRWH